MAWIANPAEIARQRIAWPRVQASPRSIRLAIAALAMGGAAFTVALLWVGLQTGQFGGVNDYTATFDPAGDLIRAGGNPYANGLVYSPPFMLVIAAISWLPVPLAIALIGGAELLALRYVVGSWIGVGIAAWCPLLAFELALGNVNLILGAFIAAAVWRRSWGAVAGGLLKLSPVLAIHDWRGAARALLVALVLTLPWLGFWSDWVQALFAALPAGSVGGPIVPIALPIRVAVALALLILRRPTATALACVIAIPAFHYQTLLLLIVPLAVWVRGRRAGIARTARIQ